MDIHSRVVAVLHIVTGMLGAAFMLIGAISMRALPYLLDINARDAKVAGFLFGFGILLIAVFALLFLAEIIAGIALLRGSSIARVVLIVYGILGMFKFPVGTALGIYTLWALLRKQPMREANDIVS